MPIFAVPAKIVLWGTVEVEVDTIEEAGDAAERELEKELLDALDIQDASFIISSDTTIEEVT